MNRSTFIAVLFAFVLGHPAFAAPDSNADTGSSGFEGNVETHFKHLTEGEDLVQIIDRTRSIICYGKMSSGGAATISCQKYDGASNAIAKPANPKLKGKDR